MLLEDVFVIDATAPLGWLAGRALADFGAEVVKLDPPHTDHNDAYWRAFNVNKRVADWDLESDSGRAKLDALLAKADICLITPNEFGAGGLFDPEKLHEKFPRLVVVSITAFGPTGPRAEWKASDIEIMAAGGAMGIAGEPDGMPLRVSEPQAFSWAGAQAAQGALVGLLNRDATGKGDIVDVSAQSSVVAALAHAPAFYDITGVIPQRAGAFMTGRSVTGARYRVFWPCRDGWLNFIFYGGHAGLRTNQALIAWMREKGADLGVLATIDWSRFDPTKASQAEVDALEAPAMKFFSTVTKREFLENAHKREMLGYPVSDVSDIATDPQLAAREYFTDVDGEKFCGASVQIDGERPALRYAPGTPFTDEVK